MTIDDKFTAIFGSKCGHAGILTRQAIKDKIVTAFPDTPEGSVIPSDYCYNMINVGISFSRTRVLFKDRVHLFEHTNPGERGDYKIIGKVSDYNGPIFWKGKQVGEWLNGVPSFFHDTSLFR